MRDNTFNNLLFFLMKTEKKIEWVLRVGVAGEFFGHGMFALGGKAAWIGWIEQLLGVQTETAVTLLTLVGLLDILVAIIVLLKPIKAALLWAAVWGFWTALVRPIVGESFWDFIERFANWAAPLALLIMLGWPKNIKEWLK